MSQKPPAENGGADGAPGGAERISVPMDPQAAVLTPPPATASVHADATLAMPRSRTSAASIPTQIGRYQIIERVGQGGMGVLYRGIDPVLDREVAIKVMIGDYAEDLEQLRPRFQREARAIARLQHSNIVTVFEFAEDDGTPYIVMEFLRGASLSARAKAEPPLTMDEKVDVVAQLCSGLHYAHEQGIVHRDVKPANIFLLADGSVKLLDFGIAKLTSSTLTRQGDVLGSPSYMSPEQIMGLDTVDGRSDVFSAGAVLFELLAGRRPFDGDTTPTIVMKILNTDAPSLDALDTAIPAPLAAVVARALHKDPAQRFQTAGEFARELKAVRRTVPSDRTIPLTGPIGPDTLAGAGPVLPAPVEPARSVRNRKLAVFAVVGAGVVAAAIALATGVGRTPSPSAVNPASASGPAATARPQSPDDRASLPPVAKDPGTPASASTPTGGASAAKAPATKEPAVKPASVTTPADNSSRAASQKDRAGASRAAAANTAKPPASATAKETPSRAATPAAAQVAVTATGPYAFSIVDGGRTVSAASTSHELNLAAGRKVRLVAPEYSLNQTVTIEDDGERRASIQVPALGKLTIRSNQETCTVQIGERVLGYPPVNNISLAAGAHQIDVVCPNGRTKSEFVNIVGGQSQRVIVQ